MALVYCAILLAPGAVVEPKAQFQSEDSKDIGGTHQKRITCGRSEDKVKGLSDLCFYAVEHRKEEIFISASASFVL